MENTPKHLHSEHPVQPQVAVGAVVFKDDRVLLVQRGKPPSRGLWSIPGGRVELGETLQQAAERETREETGIIVTAREPVFTFDVILRDDDGGIRFHYVIVDLTADYVGGDILPGDDAVNARWVSPEEIRDLNLSEMTRKFLHQHFGFETLKDFDQQAEPGS